MVHRYIEVAKVESNEITECWWVYIYNIYQILLRAARVKTVAEVTPGMKNSSRIASGITFCFINRAANGTPKMHKIASFAPIPVNPDDFTKFFIISWNSVFVSALFFPSLLFSRFYISH